MEILSGDNPASFLFSGSSTVLFGSCFSLLNSIATDSVFSITSSFDILGVGDAVAGEADLACGAPMNFSAPRNAKIFTFFFHPRASFAERYTIS